MNKDLSTYPLVSIVMCTYNGSKYLAEQLESIINQDYCPIELVIVDDCSSDDTWSILQTFKAKYSFIKIYQNEKNIGYNKNFERSIKLAQGEYIALSDQDDIWLPKKITKQVQALENNPSASLSHCKNVALENGVLKVGHLKLWNFFEGQDIREMFLRAPIAGHAMLFRASIINNFLPFPEGIIYDWWIAINACANGSIVFVNDILVYHRIHATSSTLLEINKIDSNNTLDIGEILLLFQSIHNLKSKERLFLSQLTNILRAHQLKGPSEFDWKLFCFFFSNRKIIYKHKNRKIAIFSQLKHILKLSRTNLRGLGRHVL